MSTAPPPSDETPGVTAEDPGSAPEAAPTPKRRLFPRRRPAEPAATPDGEASETGEHAEPVEPTEVIPAPPRPDGPGDLRKERRRLLTEREDTVYHLGGLAFELYRRDRLSDEVMRLRAGRVAELDDAVRDIDARLSEIEAERQARKSRTPADPSAGCCLTCRASFRAEARFCWQCGAQLVPTALGDDQVTVAIPTPPAP